MCRLRSSAARPVPRRAPFAQYGRSASEPLVPTTGGQRRPSQNRVLSYLSRSMKTFTEALNPRITFRKRNTPQDKEFEEKVKLAKAEAEKFLRGKFRRSLAFVAPTGSICYRRMPTRRGNRTQYLFRNLSDINQKP